MGPRAIGGLILLVMWGLMLLGYVVVLALNDPRGIAHWDGLCTLLSVLCGLSFVGGLIGNYFDYREVRRK
jgi:hypothetical protein